LDRSPATSFDFHFGPVEGSQDFILLMTEGSCDPVFLLNPTIFSFLCRERKRGDWGLRSWFSGSSHIEAWARPPCAFLGLIFLHSTLGLTVISVQAHTFTDPPNGLYSAVRRVSLLLRTKPFVMFSLGIHAHVATYFPALEEPHFVPRATSWIITPPPSAMMAPPFL